MDSTNGIIQRKNDCKFKKSIGGSRMKNKYLIIILFWCLFIPVVQLITFFREINLLITFLIGIALTFPLFFIKARKKDRLQNFRHIFSDKYIRRLQ